MSINITSFVCRTRERIVFSVRNNLFMCNDCCCRSSGIAHNNSCSSGLWLHIRQFIAHFISSGDESCKNEGSLVVLVALNMHFDFS